MADVSNKKFTDNASSGQQFTDPSKTHLMSSDDWYSLLSKLSVLRDSLNQPDGIKLPAAGELGMLLTKLTSVDLDIAWEDAASFMHPAINEIGSIIFAQPEGFVTYDYGDIIGGEYLIPSGITFNTLIGAHIGGLNGTWQSLGYSEDTHTSATLWQKISEDTQDAPIMSAPDFTLTADYARQTVVLGLIVGIANVGSARQFLLYGSTPTLASVGSIRQFLLHGSVVATASVGVVRSFAILT